MSEFITTSPTLDTYWRSIILFGKNSASFKFALAKTLLEFAEKQTNFVRLEELARPFALHLVDHQKKSPRQGTSKTSRFFDTCNKFNQGLISEEELLTQTTRLAFSNVIDAFHNVNKEAVPERFFIDERKSRDGITLTDNLFKMNESIQSDNLPHEVEARWRLVETAWEQSISPKLLVVKYNPSDTLFFVDLDKNRRIDITSSRDALNGYQKGKCFYCFADISVVSGHTNMCDIDHFFPYTLTQINLPGNVNINGVWNLVLSCRECNRGQNGKLARVPSIRYLERLNRRNNYLINSHHPLRDTLLAQTGQTESMRRDFLQSMWNTARQYLIHEWSPQYENKPVF